MKYHDSNIKMIDGEPFINLRAATIMFTKMTDHVVGLSEMAKLVNPDTMHQEFIQGYIQGLGFATAALGSIDCELVGDDESQRVYEMCAAVSEHSLDHALGKTCDRD